MYYELHVVLFNKKLLPKETKQMKNGKTCKQNKTIEKIHSQKKVFSAGRLLYNISLEKVSQKWFLKKQRNINYWNYVKTSVVKNQSWMIYFIADLPPTRLTAPY